MSEDFENGSGGDTEQETSRSGSWGLKKRLENFRNGFDELIKSINETLKALPEEAYGARATLEINLKTAQDAVQRIKAGLTKSQVWEKEQLVHELQGIYEQIQSLTNPPEKAVSVPTEKAEPVLMKKNKIEKKGKIPTTREAFDQLPVLRRVEAISSLTKLKSDIEGREAMTSSSAAKERLEISKKAIDAWLSDLNKLQVIKLGKTLSDMIRRLIKNTYRFMGEIRK